MKIILSAAALVLSASAAMAATSDIASHQRADFYAQGTHQFYAWCADGGDRLVSQDGFSAKNAQAKLFERMTGLAGCQLSWQGRVHS
jgi:hypothetical protein